MFDDDDGHARSNTTRDADGRLVFAHQHTPNQSGVPWWERVKRTGHDGRIALPTEDFRRTWGNKTTLQVAVNGAPLQGEFQQVVDARYPHPTSWNIGLYIAQVVPNPAPDSTAFVALITYGLGMARFDELVTVGTLTTGNQASLIFKGPVPAETLTISGFWQLTNGDATPHTTTLVLGAFVAPQVFA